MFTGRYPTHTVMTISIPVFIFCVLNLSSAVLDYRRIQNCEYYKLPGGVLKKC